MTERLDTRAHALALAARGLHVFPLRARSKEPATVNGFKDASADAGKVAAMFHPMWDGREKNLGISCGPSRLLVVDLDGAAGMAALDSFPATLTADTGKGAHLYYRGSGRSTTRVLGPGIDTRGIGGYVVAPPSMHPLGHRYQWRRPFVEVAELPAWIAEKLKPRPPAPRQRRPRDPAGATFELQLAVARFRSTAEGGRNNALNREVWRVSNLERHDVLAILWMSEAEAIGLGTDEALRTIASALGEPVEAVASWL